MPTFSRGLEQSLHRALALANERHHEYATLEHLLLALIDDQDAAAVMRGCNVDVEKLRHNLASYVESELEDLVTDGSEDSKPTAGFQRVIQRAVIHVQSSGREEVTAANVLVAIFAERESHAVFFLQEQEMTRQDAVNFINPGSAERPDLTESRATFVEEEPLLQFFVDEHLPEHLREHSKPFGDLARRLVETLPRNPQRTMALQKLLEAKDCAVRAKLFK
jgi:ATP-dependent Clp protease ATP-binding subunit ClpA